MTKPTAVCFPNYKSFMTTVKSVFMVIRPHHWQDFLHLAITRSSCWDVFCKKGVLKIFGVYFLTHLFQCILLLQFSDAFKSERKGALGTNGLIKLQAKRFIWPGLRAVTAKSRNQSSSADLVIGDKNISGKLSIFCSRSPLDNSRWKCVLFMYKSLRLGKLLSDFSHFKRSILF